MVEKWEGKIAIVTGSGSGIGAAVFKDFMKHKIIVIGLDVQVEKIKDIIQGHPDAEGKAFGFFCDISQPDSVVECFKKIEEQFGVVHILVNCAGIGRKAEILDEDETSFQKMNDVIDVNFRGLLHCTRKAFKLMKKSDDFCLIVNINSVAGHKTPFLDISLNVYGPTKYAVTAFNEAVRQELFRSGNRKIRISSLSPGIVDSDFIRASGYAVSEATETMFEDMPKLKPEAVSQGVMFILSTPYEVNVSELLIRSTGERE